RATTHEVHRRIECASGTVVAEIVFDPRFDYANHVPEILTGEHGLMAEGPNGERLAHSVSRRLDFAPLPEGGMRATVTLKSGEHLWVVLEWDARSIEAT